jgi:hypothetical protein
VELIAERSYADFRVDGNEPCSEMRRLLTARDRTASMVAEGLDPRFEPAIPRDDDDDDDSTRARRSIWPPSTSIATGRQQPETLRPGDPGRLWRRSRLLQPTCVDPVHLSIAVQRYASHRREIRS